MAQYLGIGWLDFMAQHSGIMATILCDHYFVAYERPSINMNH
jgi:hypothetical protein